MPLFIIFSSLNILEEKLDGNKYLGRRFWCGSFSRRMIDFKLCIVCFCCDSFYLFYYEQNLFGGGL